MDTNKGIRKILEFADKSKKFNDKAADTVFVMCMYNFINTGFVHLVADIHQGARSLRLTLADGKGDLWVQWYDDKAMYGCGCTVEAEQCYMYWGEKSPESSVKARIEKVYEYFVTLLKLKKLQSDMKTQFDATLNDVIKP